MKRIRFVFGCRPSQLGDRAGDNVILGIIASGCLIVIGLAIWYGKTAEAAALGTVLMAIVNAVKEGRQARSAERTIQTVTPATPPGSAS